MKRNVLVTLSLILVLILAACNGVGGNGDDNTDGSEPTEDVSAQVTDDPDDNEPRPTEVLRNPVVVAIQNIPRGTVIDQERLGVVLYPIDIIPAGAFDDMDVVVGKIAATDIFAEELILSRKLVESFESLGSVGSDAAAILDPGRVAIAVPIDRITSVAYALQPGDRVDVIVSMLFVDIDQDFQTLLPNLMNSGEYFTNITTDENGNLTIERDFQMPVLGSAFFADGFESRSVGGQDAASVSGSASFNITTRDDLIVPVVISPSEQQRPRLLTARTVTDAQVLWVGEFPRDGRIFAPAPTPTPVVTPDPEAEEAEGEAVEATPVPDRPTIITLAVRPQDAVVLTYMAESSIPMTFALRSARTQGLPDTEPVTLSYILDEYRITLPEALNFGIEPAIRSIRGITLENIFASGSSTDDGNVDTGGEAVPAEEGN